MIEFFADKEIIDWEEAIDVFERAPLGARRRDPEKLRKAFASSYAVIFAFDSGRLIGLGRALCDGEYQAAIYDLVLLPEYQGKGIGKEMLQRLCKRLPVDNIILYAVPGREGFYEKCGFKKMRTAMAKLNQSMSKSDRGYLD
jgi:ribosomal protein S18 acetylase RimI-like enzyme